MSAKEMPSFAERYRKGAFSSARREILTALSDRDLSVGQFAALVEVSQPTASQQWPLETGKSDQHLYYALNYDCVLSGLKRLALMEVAHDRQIERGSSW